MKRFLTYGTVLLLVLSLLSGCAKDTQTTDSDETPTGNEAYIARVAELEAALQKEREDRYISDSAYIATIKELQKKLNALSPDSETSKDENTGEELVFRYRLEGDKAIITGYAGTSTLVTIPAVLDGHTVVALGERAFEGQNIAAIVLPEGLEAIGWFAFYGCTTLIDITIPDSVTSIGYAVFDGCPNLTIVCNENSYAAKYADSYGLPHISP